MQSDFDRGCAEFTQTMGAVANWKHTYFGAAYSTRLRQAVNDAKVAVERMERILTADEQPSK